MNPLTNVIENNTLDAVTRHAPQHVISAIQDASANTGVDFAYLVQQASAESSFNPKANAKSSSAAGLYQFVEKTWLSMVREHGDKYGLSDLSDKISSKYTVKDPKIRQEILELRNDPEVAANMAAEFALENEQFLESHWGGDVGATELYFAHFLGAGGAASFLKARDKNPYQNAADLFPRAAIANRNVFYDSSTGRARTLEEVYQFFDKKFSLEGEYEVVDTQDSQEDDLNGEKTCAIGTLFSDNISSDISDNIVSRSFEPSHFTPAALQRDSVIYKKAASTNTETKAASFNQIQGSYFSLITNPVDLMTLVQEDQQNGDKSSRIG